VDLGGGPAELVDDGTQEVVGERARDGDFLQLKGDGIGLGARALRLIGEGQPPPSGDVPEIAAPVAGSTIGVVTLPSIDMRSDGNYGFAEGVWASMPVRTTAPGEYAVDTSFVHDAFAKDKLAVTNDELVGERETVAEMLG